MINRKYFVRAKVPHNNGTGLYSWWSGVITVKSLLPPNGDLLFESAMELSLKQIEHELEGLNSDNRIVEIETLNRIS